MSLIELKIDRIQYSETQTGAYVLFLNEPISGKKIPIIIGGIEAHSIAIGLEDDIKPQRPLTHDLMKSTMDAYKISLKKIIINKYDQGVFYAMIITEKDGIETAIDSRTSDAVALAVRFKVSIFCESNIIDEVSIDVPQADEISRKEEMIAEKELEKFLQDIDDVTDRHTDESDSTDTTELEQLSLDIFGTRNNIYTKKEINGFLKEAIAQELYEKAAKLKQYLELM